MTRFIEKPELERWLYGRETMPPAPSAVAAALGLVVSDVVDTTLLRTVGRVRSLRFILAVLHDVFPENADLWLWLEEPREDLDGSSPRQALSAGWVDRVEAVAVAAWNGQGCMTLV